MYYIILTINKYIAFHKKPTFIRLLHLGITLISLTYLSDRKPYTGGQYQTFKSLPKDSSLGNIFSKYEL